MKFPFTRSGMMHEGIPNTMRLILALGVRGALPDIQGGSEPVSTRLQQSLSSSSAAGHSALAPGTPPAAGGRGVGRGRSASPRARGTLQAHRLWAATPGRPWGQRPRSPILRTWDQGTGMRGPLPAFDRFAQRRIHDTSVPLGPPWTVDPAGGET